MTKILNKFKKFPEIVNYATETTTSLSTVISKKISTSFFKLMAILWIYLSIVPVFLVMITTRLLGLAFALLLLPLAVCGLPGWIPMWVLAEIKVYTDRMHFMKFYYTNNIAQIIFTPIIWLFLIIVSPIDSFITAVEEYSQSIRRIKYVPTKQVRNFISGLVFIIPWVIMSFTFIFATQRFLTSNSDILMYYSKYGLGELTFNIETLIATKRYRIIYTLAVLLFNMISLRSVIYLLNGTYDIVRSDADISGDRKAPSDYIYEFFSWSYISLVRKFWPMVGRVLGRLISIIGYILFRIFVILVKVGTILFRACFRFSKIAFERFTKIYTKCSNLIRKKISGYYQGNPSLLVNQTNPGKSTTI